MVDKIQDLDEQSTTTVLSSTCLELYNTLSEMQRMLVSGNHGDEYENIVKKMTELYDIIDQANNKTITFEYDVSPNTKKFLQKVHDGDGDIGSAENMLRRNISTNRDLFLKTFELDPTTIDDVYDEVIKIKDSMDAVEAAYNIMVTRSNKNMSTMFSYIDAHNEHHTKIPKAYANFDLRKNEIVLEPNELQYDLNTFKTKIHELIKDGNFIIKGYNSCGGFEFLS